MKEVSSIWYHILKFKWTNTINQMNKSNISNEQIQRLHCRFLVYKWNPFAWTIMFKWTNSIVLINKSKGRLCVITPSVQKVASIWWSSIRAIWMPQEICNYYIFLYLSLYDLHISQGIVATMYTWVVRGSEGHDSLPWGHESWVMIKSSSLCYSLASQTIPGLSDSLGSWGEGLKVSIPKREFAQITRAVRGIYSREFSFQYGNFQALPWAPKHSNVISSTIV